MSRDLVSPWFIQQMNQKLYENRHKDGWENIPIPELLCRLQEELGELVSACRADHYSVVDEAADVANLAMMIADRYREAHGDE